jgi:ribonuclease HII
MIDRARVDEGLLAMIDDSKKLTPARREAAHEAMIASGVVEFAVAEASVEEIDRLNILQATFLAMRRALAALAVSPALALVDGNRVPPGLGCRAETVVGGDARSYSIAAASIFAKVARDRHMASLAAAFPGYGWERNRGYGSAQHLEALKLLGPTPHHRMSFAPLNRLV